MATSGKTKTVHRERRLTVGEHLDELRSCILWALLSVVVCFIFCLAVQQTLMGVVMRPHLITMGRLGLPPQIKVIRYQEGFITLLKVSFIGALVLASPFVIYQIWKFVSEGLEEAERHYCLVFGPISLGCFVLGVLFGYFFLIPLGLRFLLSVLGPEVRPDITMAEYVGLVALLTLILGLLFELPLVMLFLSKLGIVTSETYARHRKPALLIAFIAGAVLTPPDPFTQIMMAVPMMGLYEIGILVSGPTKANFLRFVKLLGLAFIAAAALVAWSCLSTTGALVEAQGQVFVSSFADSKPLQANAKSKLRAGSIVRTAGKSRAKLSLRDGAMVHVNANTVVQVSGRGQLRLFQGEVFVQPVDTGREFVIRTPNGDVTASGGAFDTEVTHAKTTVIVVQGRAEIAYRGLRKTILAGHSDGITTGGEKVDVSQAIAWTKGWSESQ